MGARDWLPHGLCLAAIVLAAGVWRLSHRESEDLLPVAYGVEAPAEARIDAMRTLATRPDATAADVQDLWDEAIASDDPRVRLLAAGSDLLRFGAGGRRGTPPTPPAGAEAYLAQLIEPDAAEWLWFIVYRRKVGGMQVGSRRRLDLKEATWTLEALGGTAPPSPEAKAHVLQRAQNGMRRSR